MDTKHAQRARDFEAWRSWRRTLRVGRPAVAGTSFTDWLTLVVVAKRRTVLERGLHNHRIHFGISNSHAHTTFVCPSPAYVQALQLALGPIFAIL